MNLGDRIKDNDTGELFTIHSIGPISVILLDDEGNTHIHAKILFDEGSPNGCPFSVCQEGGL